MSFFSFVFAPDVSKQYKKSMPYFVMIVNFTIFVSKRLLELCRKHAENLCSIVYGNIKPLVYYLRYRNIDSKNYLVKIFT